MTIRVWGGLFQSEIGARSRLDRITAPTCVVENDCVAVLIGKLLREEFPEDGEGRLIIDSSGTQELGYCRIDGGWLFSRIRIDHEFKAFGSVVNASVEETED